MLFICWFNRLFSAWNH